jgi:hypothetical protein
MLDSSRGLVGKNGMGVVAGLRIRLFVFVDCRRGHGGPFQSNRDASFSSWPFPSKCDQFCRIFCHESNRDKIRRVFLLLMMVFIVVAAIWWTAFHFAAVSSTSHGFPLSMFCVAAVQFQISNVSLNFGKKLSAACTSE